MKNATRSFLMALTSVVVLVVIQASPALGVGDDQSRTDQDSWKRKILEWAGTLVIELGKGAANELGHRGAQLLMDEVTGKPSITKIQRQIDYLAEQTNVHGTELYELRRRLDKCATREEVEEAIMKLLSGIDAEFAKQAKRLKSLETDRDEILKRLRGTGEDIDKLFGEMNKAERKFQQHELRIGNLDIRTGQNERDISKLRSELDEIKRMTPTEQSIRLAVAGFYHYREGSFDEASRSFLMAHAYDPDNPAPLYGAAISFKQLGKDEMAAMMVAKGAAAERNHPLTQSPYYRTCMSYVQGRTRLWLEDNRLSPIYGPRASGEVRIIHITGPESIDIYSAKPKSR